MIKYLSIKNVMAIGGSWLATRKLIAREYYLTIQQNVQDAVNKCKADLTNLI